MFEKDPTIKGHPELVLPGGFEFEQHRGRLRFWRNETKIRETTVVITLCAECGQMRSVLFLDKNRWFCTKCRNEGAAAPSMVPITRPREGK